MAKGPLRNAIEDLMLTNPATVAGKSWWERVKERWAHWYDTLQKARATNPVTSFGFILEAPFYAVIYSFTGAQFAIQPWEDFAAKPALQELNEGLTQSLQDIFSNADVARFAEVFGTALATPFFSFVDQFAQDDDVNPEQFMKAFLGFNSAIQFSTNAIGLAIEAASGGAIKDVSEALNETFRIHGLRYMSERVIEPTMRLAIMPVMERFYRKKYRPTRFAASDLRDLYALGRITRDEVSEGARAEGWRDADIEHWLALAYRNLTQGDIFDAFHQNLITKEETVTRLRVLGYKPEDIPIIFALNPPKAQNDEKSTSASTARAAYRDHLIGVDELTAILKALKYSDQEIGLIVAIEDANNAQTAKGLTLSQIKDAWANGVLSLPEARHWLEVEGFEAGTIDILIETWKAAAAPVFLKLNKGTILGAYVEGILNRNEAAGKLTGIGLSADDARLELDLAEARNPTNFGRPTTRAAKTLSPSNLSEMLAAGLITPDIMFARLKELGYSEVDAGLLTDTAVQRLQTAPILLGVGLIQRAYLAGVIVRTEARDRLLSIDFTPEDAELVLTTIEREHPEVFNPELIASSRLPSIGALVDAVKNGIIDETTFFNKAAELGFAPGDAAIYLQLALASAPVATKSLTSAQVVNAYGAGIFSRGLAQKKLTGQGYSDYDAGVLLRLEKPGVAESDEFAAILTGALDWPTGIANLLAAHYTPDDVRDAFTAANPATLTGLGITLNDINGYLTEIAPFFTPKV